MSPRWTPDPNIRRGRSVVFNLHVHLVFVTKYRRDVLNDPILTRSVTRFLPALNGRDSSLMMLTGPVGARCARAGHVPLGRPVAGRSTRSLCSFAPGRLRAAGA